jgi:hypothetical protein
MALSDQLSDLAARAKDLEDRAAAARQKTKSDLEHDVEHARESAKQQADALHANASDRKDKVADWWDGMQKSWTEHVDKARKRRDDRKAAHDAKSAQKAADRADDDAAFAIDYACAAVEEAEYAVLDAALAHMEADELASATASVPS